MISTERAAVVSEGVILMIHNTDRHNLAEVIVYKNLDTTQQQPHVEG